MSLGRLTVAPIIAVAVIAAGTGAAAAVPRPHPGAGVHGSAADGTIAAKSGPGKGTSVRHAGTVAPTDATGALSTVSSATVHGGYTAAGIGMRNLGTGTISITGVPAGATVQSATLLWDILADQTDPTLAQGTFNGTPVSGTEWASGASPCWPAGSNFSYETDVTSLVAGNGSYQLAGFATGESDGADPWNVGSAPPLLEGASLVVVYSLASMPQTTIQLAEGATETDSGNTAGATLSGFTASAAPSVTTTYIVADGQYGNSTAAFNGTTLSGVTFPGADPQAVPNYSLGNLWDTTTADASSLVNAGDTSATLTVTGYGDCLVWVGQVLAVSTSATCSKVTADVSADTVLVSAINVSGTCFAPGERVDVLLNTEAGGTLLGTINAGPNGSISASDINGVILPRSFRIPLTTTRGTTTVTVPVRSDYAYQLDVIGSGSGNGVSMQVQFHFNSAGTLAGVSETNAAATLGGTCAPPPTVAGPPVPLPGYLHTHGRWIEGADGARVKLVSVNWYGAEEADFVPGGLDCQSIAAIANEISSDGFNSVRLPWSNAMLEEDPSVCSSQSLDQPCIDPAFLRANPQLMGDGALGILQTVVAALRQAGVMVALDNHTTDAQWAPGAGNGVWWGGVLWDDLFGTSGTRANWRTRDDLWKDDWIRMVGLFGTQPNVIGADLRNEPDANNSYGVNLTWGTATGPMTRQAWAPTAEWAGNAILAADPNLLIMVEGLGNSGDFTHVYCPAKSPCPGAIQLSRPSRLVYSPHSYSNYTVGTDNAMCLGYSAPYQNLTQGQLACALGHAWGFILTQGQPYTAPIWVGEWGVCNTSDSCAASQNGTFRDNFIAYLGQADEDWTYWPLNGTHSNGGSSSLGAAWFSPETYGILNSTWNQPQNQSLMNALATIQACHQHGSDGPCWAG